MSKLSKLNEQLTNAEIGKTSQSTRPGNYRNTKL